MPLAREGTVGSSDTDLACAAGRPGRGAAKPHVIGTSWDPCGSCTARQKEDKGREARALIDPWKPDLLYTSDDEAQEFVAMHYAGGSLPIVFSGVNKTPGTYGFDGAGNVAGVLEQEHSVESVKLLQALLHSLPPHAICFENTETAAIHNLRAAAVFIGQLRHIGVDYAQGYGVHRPTPSFATASA